ncbi:MAG TPA: hypothetical protein VMM12_02620 [Longimicrobiales bacterium]|nr:hypothetical protein [Longimicrobiales bacterium]
MLDPEGRALADELKALFRRGAEATLSDPDFDAHARRVLDYAIRHVPAYAGYCRARGVDGGDVAGWREIPAVPTAAFKELRLLAAGATAEAVFRTSGTTRGAERRGRHEVADLDLYRASLRPMFRSALLPDGASLRFLSLMPPAGALPDSSLAFMIGDVMVAFGGAGSGVFADGDGLDRPGLEAALRRAVADGAPVLLLGTSAAFIHWLDDLAAEGTRLALPDGSRLMDTGGFKGRGRSVAAADLRAAYRERLGIPGHACINEYGMTEMLSQLYDTTLRESGTPAAGARPKAGPPWLRSVAVDPETLAPLDAGRPGLLRHIDLANLASIPAIQTEDLGRVDERGRVLLEGRAAGAPPRGCSLAMDLLLGGAG